MCWKRSGHIVNIHAGVYIVVRSRDGLERDGLFWSFRGNKNENGEFSNLLSAFLRHNLIQSCILGSAADARRRTWHTLVCKQWRFFKAKCTTHRPVHNERRIIAARTQHRPRERDTRNGQFLRTLQDDFVYSSSLLFGVLFYLIFIVSRGLRSSGFSSSLLFFLTSFFLDFLSWIDVRHNTRACVRNHCGMLLLRTMWLDQEKYNTR